MVSKWIGMIAAMSLVPTMAAADVETGWVFYKLDGEANLYFGGKDKEMDTGLGYIIHGFSCTLGAGKGMMMINEGMPDWMKTGSAKVGLATSSKTFNIAAEIVPNEEAGTSGFQTDLTGEQLRAALESDKQFYIETKRKTKIRVGLRGSETFRTEFLSACGIK